MNRCRSSLALLLVIATHPIARSAEGARVLTDVPFLAAGRAERLDMYMPAARPERARSPALVWIHGGGWAGGTKNEARAKEICTTLAEAGYVAVSIDYRLGDGVWPLHLSTASSRLNLPRCGRKTADMPVAARRAA